MKYILSVLFIYSSYFSFGQMTFSEMIKIHKMDFEGFETYAIGRGYELENFDRDDENLNGIVYVKGVEKQTKYLKLYDKFYAWGVTVDYQTNNSTEVLNIKNQSISMGYKLSDTYFNDKTQVKVYSSKKNTLRVFTMPPNEEGDRNWVTYEITLSEF